MALYLHAPTTGHAAMTEAVVDPMRRGRIASEDKVATTIIVRERFLPFHEDGAVPDGPSQLTTPSARSSRQ